ncbi:uncharacterized protein LOC126424635 [Schistocerca serialis cubense]|uniref:uncharacterized protein LOC126424635 n=1 Tax=Schistocerca serialis cubense TaxID=2023355 RepID=UPI00214E1AFB|nr:uncharacterized protein LOC126424635 [Schistocerca serialis cubense]
MVAELIAQGVPDTTILKKVRESIHVGLFRRVHLLSKQDIRNIRKEYKRGDSSAHQDDATSVDLWVFMSVDCDSYYSAWSVVMGHSDIVTDGEKFSELLDGFLTWCAEEEGTEEFGKYFKDRYSWRAHMWAYSYRIGLGLNTNMFLEANHKTLKYSYVLKKINNRVDKLSHRRGCGINKELIHCVEDGTWHVYTVSDRPPYTVTYTENSCTACPLSYTECKICVHSCVCSCTDNLIRGNLYEHIHAVEISKGTVKLPLQDRFCRVSSVQELTQIVAQQTSGAGSTVDYRAALEDRLTIVQQVARSASSETAGSLLASFDKLIKEMRAGIASQKELVGPHFLVTSAPPNETYRIQRQFQSVRKTCETKEHSFATPSCAEIETII